MNRIFLDTNIILDLLIREEYKENIRIFLDQTQDKDLFISYLTIANAAYIMRKLPKSVVNENIRLLLQIFSIVPNTAEQIKEAIKTEAPDFENMLQYQSALSSNCDIIITRNSKDFSYSTLPVMSVEEYLKIQR